MGYSTNFTGMNAALMAAFGQTVTYTTRAGVSSSIHARVEYGWKDDARGYAAAIAIITVNASDVAAPAEGDAVTIGAEVWTVRIDDNFKGDGTEWTFAATAKERRRFA